jgi:phage terminase large subunit-like protein
MTWSSSLWFKAARLFNLNIPPGLLNLSQGRFLRSRSKFVLFAGGFGSGKSTALAIKVLQLVSLNPGLPGLLVGATYGSLFSTVLAELLRICSLTILDPAMRPVVRRDDRGKYIRFACGTIVYLRSAEYAKGIDGLSVAWLCGDEVRHWNKAAYEVSIARVRLRVAPFPQRAFASTPAIHWMADEFNAGKLGRELITAGTGENARNLESGYVDNLRVSYSSRMQRAVIEGHFTILEGAVYENYDPFLEDSPWLVDHDPTTLKNLQKKNILAIDPGFRSSAWLWVQEVSPCSWIVVDEMMPEGRAANSVVAEINSRTINGTKLKIDEVFL